MEIKTLIFVVLLTILLSSTAPVRSEYYSPSTPYNPVPLQKTNLRFFLHDIVSGPNPTAIPIVGPKANNDPTLFGQVVAIDDPLTEGPEITSRTIGNARGMYSFPSHDKNLTLIMYVDLGFTSGKYQGSSLSVFSRNPVTENPREMAVVGGRGLFRYAQGFVTVNTQFLNTTSGDAVLEYNVEVVHP